MYCTACGGRNEEGNEYCVTCGAKLAQDTAADKSDDLKRSQVKQRHGCLTTYLIVMIILSSIAVISVPASLSLTKYLQDVYPDYILSMTWATWIILAANVAQIGFAVAIFKWKRWGVYAFVTATVVDLVLGSVSTEGISGISGIPDNLVALSTTIGIIMSIMIGILTIVLLIVSLKMGKPSGWDQLE